MQPQEAVTKSRIGRISTIVAGVIFFTYVLSLCIFVVAYADPEVLHSRNVTFFDTLHIFFYAITPIVIFYLLPNRWVFINTLSALGVAFLMAFDGMLIYYAFTRRNFFDFFYFWTNRSVALSTLHSVYPFFYLRVIIILLIFFIFIFLLFKTKSIARYSTRNKSGFIISFLLAISFIGYLFLNSWSPTTILAKKAFATMNALNFKSYNDAFLQSIHAKYVIPDQKKGRHDSIFALQLESLNSEFVTPTTTPMLYDLAQQGFLLRRHSSGGILTRRADEILLCGILPTLSLSSSYFNYSAFQSSDADSVLCLPQVLRSIGYKTLFFINYDLNYLDYATFTKKIGFDEIHGSEIMQPGDPKLKWGDREDIFFRRVSEYIQNKNYDPGQKLFVFTLVGASNHIPFMLRESDIRPDVNQRLPFQNSKSYRDNRINSAFVQDAYIFDYWEQMNRLSEFSSSHRYIFGDHPIGISTVVPEYSNNSETVDQKNFLTSLLYIPPHATRDTTIGSVIDSDVGSSHQGFVSTVLESLGHEERFRLSKSFYSIFKGQNDAPHHCVVNVQPFTRPSVALVQYPKKVVIDLTSRSLWYIDVSASEIDAPEHRMRIHDNFVNAGDYLNKCLNDTLLSYLREKIVY